MNKVIGRIALVLAMAALVACGAEQASHATVELNRSTAKENSEALGKAYAYQYVKHIEPIVRGRTDSTIDASCPMGDGWTSVDLVDPNTGVVSIKLKCSTISPSIGCMPDSDFKARKQYNQQEGTCDRSLQNPLPKLGR